MNQPKRNIEFFAYVAQFTAANLIPVTGRETQVIQIQNDADFVWVAAAYHADVAAAGQTDATRIIPLATVLMTNGGTNRQLSALANAVANNLGSPIPAVFGGREPLYLPKPLMLAANSTFSLQVSNFDAAQAYNIRLTMLGYKVFNS